MIIKLPNGYRCDIGNDLGSLYVIHEVFYLGNYDSLLIKSTDSVLDCGAHIGIFALKVADLCSRVIAVEPASSNFNLLQKNIKLNGLEKKIVPIKRIIYAKSGIFARLCLAESGGWHSIYYNPRGSVSEISETISVDDLSASLGVKFDVIKIDVEGAEVDLLNGAKQTLAYSREVIIEYHSRDLLKESVKILRSHGFHCEITHPKRFSNINWLLGYMLLNYRLLQHRQKPNFAKVFKKPHLHAEGRGILYAYRLL